MGDIGAGFQTPLDHTSDFAVVKFLVRQFLADLDTMKLVEVVAVTGGGGAIAKAGTVDVKPLVSMVDGDGNATEHGTVYGIPWFRAQGGNGALIIDPKVGDVGYVICADRDSDAVKGAGAVTPGSTRRYNIADGVYVGGIKNDIPEQYIAFSDDGVTIKDSFGNKIEMKSGSITITPVSGTVSVVGNLGVSGNLLIGGEMLDDEGNTLAVDIKTKGEVIAKVGAGQVGLSTHTHTQAVDSHGDIESPTNAPSGGT